MLIGVTGGVGCGKTTVARRLSELLTARYINSDDLCRELMGKGREGYRQFVQRFGDRFLDEDGNIDRPMLRGHVFSVESGRRQLEAILHPLVRDRIGSISRMSSKGSVVIAEVPLLFESGWEPDFDRVVCVVASLETAISRIVQRDLVSREDAERIVAAQMDLAEKARRSDWTIDNDGDPAQFERQLAKVAHMITELSVRL